jgi:hypothetical protein
MEGQGLPKGHRGPNVPITEYIKIYYKQVCKSVLFFQLKAKLNCEGAQSDPVEGFLRTPLAATL